MNNELDVLRYWLSEWSFRILEGELICLAPVMHPNPGHVTRTVRTMLDGSDEYSRDHADHLCAELRRKYREREEVWRVETNLNDVPQGSSVCPCVVHVHCKTNGYWNVMGSGDTELLATIEAGRKLREALEG